ncbi:lamin tail domain-containing protein [Rariglobus hedericola]|uniref:PEP-CTERM sorting domain-containing protein n=1 Tax=Rariglobus hedericola TaxID=2597822 RepID=A0A556QSX8_9BACT|nr:lamin tail domain-containing protein [Rariglobus hedericola]TSJ79747.1 PEP-CTERM sorting domain-containing protein [Rariglobus hedericola]
MNYSSKLLCALLSFGAFTAVVRSAPVLIVTEAMSSSGTGGTADWFELTNMSGSAIDVTGFKVDDASNAFATSLSLLGVTSIAAGESVIFIEGDSTTIASFRSFWGGVGSVQVGSYSGGGIGLSSGSDAVNVFDSVGTFITGASFGAATEGRSFYYNGGAFTGNTTVLTEVSANGVAGAFVSANVLGNIGSPGAIPEPSTYAALFGAGVLGFALFRRRRVAA